MQFSDIIGLFGGPLGLARQLNVPTSTVSMWKARGSIPPRWGGAIVEAAERMAKASRECGDLATALAFERITADEFLRIYSAPPSADCAE